MTRQVRCECGYIARADNDDAVVALIQDHLVTDHPELKDSITPEHIRSWIELVPN
jgi:predicted small metal-binding protein